METEKTQKNQKKMVERKRKLIEMKNSFHDFISRLDRTNKESVSLKIWQNQYQIEKQRENKNWVGGKQ